MKPIISKLGIVMLLLVAVMSGTSYSQNQAKQKKMFVRVFDFDGKKIGKGNFHFATDSILELKKGSKLVAIPITDISYIKTKRSPGHTMLLQTAIGTTIGVVLGAATAEPDKELGGYSAGNGALVLGSFGAIIGAGAGGIAIAIKKTEIYVIDGDIENWRMIIDKFK